MDIKIVIYFIIICLIPPASAVDALWAAKSSGFIGSNDELSFENYFVKTETGYILRGEVQNHPSVQVSYNDIHGITRNTISNTIESGKMVEKTQQESRGSTKPLNVAPTDLVWFMVASYITIAGVILSGALIAYSVAEVLR